MRLGAVSSSDEATQKDLAVAAAGEVASAVRFCYAHGLLTNPNLQGSLTISAVVTKDGWLSLAGASASVPDNGVVSCVTTFANRSKVNAPSKTPTKVSIPFTLTPGGK